MSLTGFVVATIAVGAGSLLQGSVGFGLNLLAAPVLLAVDPKLVPGPAAALGLVLVLLTAVRERESVDIRGVGWALVGRVPGVVAGTVAVVMLPQRGLVLFFAVVVLAAVVMSAGRWRLHPTPGTLLGAGAASGFMGTTSSIGGPPIALVYQSSPGATLRGTLAGYFSVGIVMTLIGLALAGRFGADEAWASVLLVPPLVIGFVLSRWTAPVLDRRGTRGAVLIISAASAVMLLVRELTAL